MTELAEYDSFIKTFTQTQSFAATGATKVAHDAAVKWCERVFTAPSDLAPLGIALYRRIAELGLEVDLFAGGHGGVIDFGWFEMLALRGVQ